MKVPMSDDVFISVINLLHDKPEIVKTYDACPKCQKWNQKMRKDLADCNFDYFKHDVIHLVNHLERDCECEKEASQ